MARMPTRTASGSSGHALITEQRPGHLSAMSEGQASSSWRSSISWGDLAGSEGGIFVDSRDFSSILCCKSLRLQGSVVGSTPTSGSWGCKVEVVEQGRFQTEKGLQGLIESNLQEIFNCRSVATEFCTGARCGSSVRTS